MVKVVILVDNCLFNAKSTIKMAITQVSIISVMQTSTLLLGLDLIHGHHPLLQARIHPPCRQHLLNASLVPKVRLGPSFSNLHLTLTQHLKNNPKLIFPTQNLLKINSFLLHVSTITKNLLSVSKFPKDNLVNFEFHPNFCLVINHRQPLKCCYEAFLERMDCTTLITFSCSLNQQDIWFNYLINKSCTNQLGTLAYNMCHYRLGHPHHKAFKVALDSCNVVLKKSRNEFCFACCLGKVHCLPSHSSHEVYNSSFELLFYDLWVHHPCFLFKLIVEENFELSFFSLQHMKLFTNLHVHVLTIRMVQVNESNIILTFFAHASLPLKFWDSTTYLINCMPTTILKMKYPYLCLFNYVFECDYYPHLRPYNQHKLCFIPKNVFSLATLALTKDINPCTSPPLSSSTPTITQALPLLVISSFVPSSLATKKFSFNINFVPPTVVQDVCHNTTSTLLPFVYPHNIHPMNVKLFYTTTPSPLFNFLPICKSLATNGFLESNKTIIVPFKSTKPNLLLKTSINN
ncbi:hypothetical protein CR513_03648, partial [Mucuna pruriens]